MINQIESIIKQTKVFSCIDCGKCISSCPLVRAGLFFSPRVIMEKALLGFRFLEDRNLWLCLTCDVCSEKCPSSVRFNAFVEAIRDLAIKEGVTKYCIPCKSCGKYFATLPILEHIKEAIKKEDVNAEYLMLCDRCRRLYITKNIYGIDALKV